MTRKDILPYDLEDPLLFAPLTTFEFVARRASDEASNLDIFKDDFGNK
jgi:hypothetical protein